MIKTIESNPSLIGNSKLVSDVTFSVIEGEELKMQLLLPWAIEQKSNLQLYPTIVFLQGSGWTKPDYRFELPQLSDYARQGYVVAMITHRSCLEGHPMPAFLEDSKTAIRFLRKNAEKYQIDPNRMGFFGTSSGGNTALLVALTGDEPRYKTKEYSEYSDSISCGVACFPPTDLKTLLEGIDEGELAEEELFFGGTVTEKEELVEQMSPLKVLNKRTTYADLLLLHGDKDDLVPFDQSSRFYEATQELGLSSDLVRVKSAPHEGSFWSEEVHQTIQQFLSYHLK